MQTKAKKKSCPRHTHFFGEFSKSDLRHIERESGENDFFGNFRWAQARHFDVNAVG